MTIKGLTAVAVCLALSGCATLGAKGGKDAGPTAEEALLAPLRGGLAARATSVQLSDRDKLRAAAAEYKALEHGDVGADMPWTGVTDGLSGVATAGQPFRVGSQDCRQLTENITKGGVPEEIKGSACRNGDGSWSLLD